MYGLLMFIAGGVAGMACIALSRSIERGCLRAGLWLNGVQGSYANDIINFHMSQKYRD